MKTDEFYNPIITVNEGKRALLYGHSIEGAIIDDEFEVEAYCKGSRKVLDRNALVEGLGEAPDLSVEDYFAVKTQEWNIPEEYKNIDMLDYLLDKCLTEEEQERVKLEYAMFEERDLIPLLQFLVFIVDYMRKNKIVWGVGRGSSVSSYCLYLMGVHKINSLKYNLPIEEFLK